MPAKTALLAGDLLLGYRAPIGVRTRQRLGEAYRCFVLAESLGSTAVATRAMNSRATLYGQRGDPGLALALQHEAVGRGTAARTAMPGLLARRAELHAKAGADAAAMRDLDDAERALRSGSLWWCFNPTSMVELAAYRGAVLATLGRHEEANQTPRLGAGADGPHQGHVAGDGRGRSGHRSRPKLINPIRSILGPSRASPARDRGGFRRCPDSQSP